MAVLIEPSDSNSDLYETKLDWTPENTDLDRYCHVCSAPSNGYHFNAPSCSACAAFFRRTVTLNRKFECSHKNDCRINYAMRVICRACRYRKCIQAGMDRRAVQPRRDAIMGRRKIKYPNVPRQTLVLPIQQGFAPIQLIPGTDKGYIVLEASNVEFSGLQSVRSHSFSSSSTSSASPLVVEGSATQSFVCVEPQPTTAPTHVVPNFLTVSPQGYERSVNNCGLSTTCTVSSPTSTSGVNAEAPIQTLLLEEAKTNERRRLLYADRYLSELLSESDSNLPFFAEDLRPLQFTHIRKEIRSMILVNFESLRAWTHYEQLSTQDKKILLRRFVLFHTIIEPAYLTLKIGYPEKFVMPNGMFVSMNAESNIGWEDEEEINSETKKMLYKPLMDRVIAEVIEPMRELDLTHVEYCVFKALVAWKSSLHTVSAPTADILTKEINELFVALHCHYSRKNLDEGTIAERIGNLVLLISNVYCVGFECLESHHKIDLFDLWQLDSLLLKLLCNHK